ncbi:phage tail tube protein [Glycomyces tarimensis]
MNDIIVDGTVKVAFVPTVADLSAPTTTEIAAGVDDLDLYITADGLVGFEPDTAEVDTTALRSKFDNKRPGRASFSGTMLRIKKQTDTDTPFTTLTRNTEGVLVIRRYTDAEPDFAAADAVACYPIQCGTRRDLGPEANTTARYEVPTMITADPVLDAVVGAGA